MFRSVSKGNRVSSRGLSPDGLSRLVTRAGLDATGFSAHSLRAGFVTYAAKRGATSLQIARQTRHKDLASIGIYTRIEDAWEENAATQLPPLKRSADLTTSDSNRRDVHPGSAGGPAAGALPRTSRSCRCAGGSGSASGRDNASHERTSC